MKKKAIIKKGLIKAWRLIFLQGFILLGLSSISLAISVSVPQQNDADDVIVSGPSVINTQETEIFETVQVVNRYLWFIIGAIAMWVMVYAGAKLMTSEWNAEEMTKANQMLLGAVIGIAIAIFSYAAVRIIVNLL